MSSRCKAVLAALLAGICAVLMLLPPVLSREAPKIRYTAASGRSMQMAPIRLPDGEVPVNTGDLAEIMRLPGIGEKIGQAVIDERALNGPYHYPEDLLAVRGIGEKTLERMREQLKLP